MVKNLFTVLNSVSTSMLRRKVSFEEATEISTPRLTVNIKSFTPSSAGGELRAGFANFELPDGKDMFRGGMAGLTSVNQKVAFFLSMAFGKSSCDVTKVEKLT